MHYALYPYTPFLLIKTLRFIGFLLAGIFLCLSLALGLLYYYKDRLIYVFLAEANRYVQVDVNISKVKIEVWETFPEVSMQFENLIMYESGTKNADTLLAARNLYLSFSAKDLLQQKYTIKQLIVNDAKLRMKIFGNGSYNFAILKSSGDSTHSGSISFKLSKILLNRVEYTLIDQANAYNYSFYIKSAKAGFGFQENDWDVQLHSDLVCHELRFKRLAFLVNKSATLESKLSYTHQNKKLSIAKALVNLDRSMYDIKGIAHLGEIPTIDFTFEARNSSFNSILSLLPNAYAAPLRSYQSKGNIWFKGYIKGAIHRKNIPQFGVDFSSKNASFMHPDLGIGFENVRFKGTYLSSTDQDRTSYFALQQVYALAAGKPIQGQLIVRDIQNPYIEAEVKGSFDLGVWSRIWKPKEVSSASGQASLHFSYKGRSQDLAQSKYQNIIAQGSISGENIFIKSTHPWLHCQNVRLQAALHKTSLQISNLEGTLAGARIKAKMDLPKILDFLFLENQKLQCNVESQIDTLEIDKFLQTPTGSGSSSKSFKYDLDIRSGIRTLKWKKTTVQDLAWSCSLTPTAWKIQKCTGKYAKGGFELNGETVYKHGGSTSQTWNILLTKIPLDTVLTDFDNFDQRFITDRNISGLVTASINVDFATDSNLHVVLPSLVAAVQMDVQKGELVDFEPLQRLSRFVDEDALRNIQFSELHNQFFISNQVITIPSMEIKTNLTTLQLQGVHRFDNSFEYHLKLPLRNYKKAVQAEEEASVEKSNGWFYLYLTLKSDGKEVKVTYDGGSVKEHLKQKWREQKAEVKELFRKDAQKKRIERAKEQELSEDEFLEQ